MAFKTLNSAVTHLTAAAILAGLWAGLTVLPMAAAADTAADLSAEQTAPRYRMADPDAANDGLKAEREPAEADFYWQNLTAGSPASGSDPVIGNRYYHEFYDFRDGFDLPKYSAKAKQPAK